MSTIASSFCSRLHYCSVKVQPCSADSVKIKYCARAGRAEEILGVYLVLIEEKTDYGYRTTAIYNESTPGVVQFNSQELEGCLTANALEGKQYKITLVVMAETDGCRVTQAISVDYHHDNLE